jgi:hypothetical protein
MTRIAELDNEAWDEWVASRPQVVQELCKRLPPDRLYRMEPSGNRVTIYSYSEDGTVTVVISGEYNAVIFDRRVFGISPDDLAECDLPPDGEMIGTVLTEPEEIDGFCEALRDTGMFSRQNGDATMGD